jgi:hypothetical protein
MTLLRLRLCQQRPARAALLLTPAGTRGADAVSRARQWLDVVEH